MLGDDRLGVSYLVITAVKSGPRNVNAVALHCNYYNKFILQDQNMMFCVASIPIEWMFTSYGDS